MKTYKFKTKISESGTIQIPFDPKLFDNEVEVVISPASREDKSNLKASEFVEKWAGFLNDSDTDKSKLEYLEGNR